MLVECCITVWCRESTASSLARLTVTVTSSSLTWARVLSAPVATTRPPRATASSSHQAHQLQHVADSFEYVLEAMSSTNEKHIPVDPLLDACRSLLRVLEETGPKAVARDFENNIRKIESACHVTNRRTISSLLQVERDSREGKDSCLHLSEHSGAWGCCGYDVHLHFNLTFTSDYWKKTRIRLTQSIMPTNNSLSHTTDGLYRNAIT